MEAIQESFCYGIVIYEVFKYSLCVRVSSLSSSLFLLSPTTESPTTCFYRSTRTPPLPLTLPILLPLPILPFAI